jgi:hypothetical protein
MAVDLRTTQEYLNAKLGTVGLSKQQCLIRLAALAAQDATTNVAASNYAGTPNQTTQNALKNKVGVAGKDQDNVVIGSQELARRL